MDELPPDDGDSFSDDMFETEVYEAIMPQKRDFLPWHKPRKQFVRHHQWCCQVGQLLKYIQHDGRVLKYLGLPGNDLLDLRYFHSQVCEPNNLRLRFLGFNSGAQPSSRASIELNISLDEVRRLGSIDERSDVIPDDFCRVADESSIACKKAMEFGPYDVINLDLCDGFASHEPGQDGNTHYDALNRLITLQAKRKDPWLLFLTTRTGQAHIHHGVSSKFLKTYRENLNSCERFRHASGQCFDIDDEVTLEKAVSTSEGHLNVFLVGLCKWMIGLALTQKPQSKIEVKSAFGYRVDKAADNDDIVSIALRFEPRVGVTDDPLGLSGVSVVPLDECDLSARVPKRVKSRKSVDEILADNLALYEEMKTATEGLLALARYDIDAYREWVKSN